MYEIKLRKHFTLTNGVQLKNIGGKVVIFRKGVAVTDNENVALAARRYRYIESVTKLEETPEVLVEPVAATVAVTEPEETPVEDEDTVEDENPEEVPQVEQDETEQEEESEVESPVVEEEEDTPNVALLYEELGTWTAVAERLGITTSALRKLREEQGLL